MLAAHAELIRDRAARKAAQRRALPDWGLGLDGELAADAVAWAAGADADVLLAIGAAVLWRLPEADRARLREVAR